MHGLKFNQFACMQHLYKCTYMQSACVWKQFGLHLCKLITSSMHANECMHSTSVQHSCNSHPCSQNVCSTCAVRMCAVHSCIAHINNLHICCTESSIYATCVLQLKIFVRVQPLSCSFSLLGLFGCIFFHFCKCRGRFFLL